MRKGIIWTMLCITAAIVCAAVAVVTGIAREKADLAQLLHVLDLQLQAELSKTAALPSLLASHPLLLEGLRAEQAPAEVQTYLDHLVLQTGQFSILLANGSGQIIAAGLRNPDLQILPGSLAPDLLARLQSGTLSRRVLPEQDSSGLFEAGLSIRQQGADIAGYIVVSDALEDLAISWRSMPDRLILQSLEGEVLFATTPYDSDIYGLLRATTSSLRSGLRLALERQPKALLPYAIVGGSMGFLAIVAVLLGAAFLQNKRQMVRAEITSLTNDTALLEKRVVARTKLLTAEIIERQNAQAALREKQAQLIQAAKFKAIGDLAAGLSHELSQPLFALQSSLSTLEQHLIKRAGPALDTLHKSQHVANRIERLLRNLRAYARNETEAPVAVKAQTIVNAALEILAAPLKQANIVVIQKPPNSTLVVRAGPVRLQQVIVNVVANAVDAMAANEGGIIHITYGPNGQICIRDSGPGFAALDKAAEPFFTTKSDQHGLGLGLSISADLLKSFGGFLALSNSPAGGAQVILGLPTGQEPASS
ncbi:MAG: hypothetical protein JKX69_05070 [Rhodobacteraceae bacterium]|nr:hypothetical protein [Paracoccaceae bacterium]